MSGGFRVRGLGNARKLIFFTEPEPRTLNPRSIRNQQSRMLSLLVFDSLRLWPVSAAMALALTAAVLWLYPSQVRSVGIAGWAPLLLRWVAIGALAASLLRPVVVQPKTAEELGSVLVLFDCSKSMSVIDTGRGIEQRVALADALGGLPAGVRSATAATVAADLKQLE